MRNEDALVAADFPNLKHHQSTSYNRGWEVGVHTAWDASRGRFDNDALTEAQEEVSRFAAVLKRLEAEGRKYYSDSTEETLNFVSCRDEYDYYRGLVDGYLDDRHYAARHTNDY
jgi:hypothetical protein